MTSRQEIREILVGMLALVLLLAAAGLVSLRHHLAESKSDDVYRVVATFNRVDGLDVGAPAVVSGIRVGTVESLVLDPSYRVRMTLSIASYVALPTDSSASIQTDGLFGAKSVRIEPGGDEEALKDGGAIDFTQDSVVVTDLLDLIIGEGKAARADTPVPSAAQPGSR